MTQDERQFFKAPGAHIAELRKVHGLTQVQLAEALELSQQMIAPYEGGRRLPVSLLPAIAHAPAVSIEALIGEEDATPAKRGPAPKPLQQIERIQRLPKAQQRFVMQMIDTVLAQQDR
ncbi:MAG TPA: helix-turn-helix domain-containing protein [Steroidobacteraceae bacterium]